VGIGKAQALPNKSLHSPPDASVTALAFATAAPDAGASELKRYTSRVNMRQFGVFWFLFAGSAFAGEPPTVKAELAEMIETVVLETGFNISIRETTLESATINSINGRDVCSEDALQDALALQEAFNRQPQIKRNFGPAFYSVTSESGETKFLDRESLMQRGVIKGCTDIQVSIQSEQAEK
jgi:hypothetical protein